MMKTQKNKGKIRYRKLLLCLLAAVFLLGVLLYALGLGFRYFSSALEGTRDGFPNDGKPMYSLFVGIDQSDPAKADAAVLISMNLQKQEMTVISLPPSTQMEKEKNPSLQLQDVYASGGAEGTKSAVENLLHIRISRYAVLNEENFQKLIDGSGGLDLYVEKNMVHESQDGQPDIQIRQGYQTLKDGEALGYIRYIDGHDQIGRIQREERFMKSFLAYHQKNMGMTNWVMAYRHWNALESNITQTEAASFSYRMTYFPGERVHFMILPGEWQTYQGQPIWAVNPVDIQKIIGVTLNQEQDKGDQNGTTGTH